MRGAIVEYYPQKFKGDVEANRPIAFIDRDGVINVGSPNYINHPEELIILDGAASRIGELRRSGFSICIVTNQSAINRGLWGPNRLHSIHNHLQEMLLRVDEDALIDIIVTCPHRQIDRCFCRKPMPGMLHIGDSIIRGNLKVNVGLNTDILPPDNYKNVNWWKEKPSSRHNLDLIVGDRKSDLGAGWAFGVRLFQVSPRLGIDEVGERIINANDNGDYFQPIR